ncbi:MAG: hypothetical protein J5545_12585 [Bacteroidaceae bacterium]|nr:hypothetical protein [Bacteroidaceae bacterium]
MKKIMMTLAAVLCCAMNLTVLTSCSVEDNPVNPQPQPEPEPLADYTLMYYGHGGGNRDNYYLAKVADFYNADPAAFEKVNVVVQFKYSTAENLKTLGFSDEYIELCASKTSRWAVDPEIGFQGQFTTATFYGEDNADITCPDSLTNFINWVAKNYPAKKYMLIVHDHGGGYRPDDELPETTSATTRGMIYDDGHDSKHFTAKSFRRALAAANVRCETVFMDACLMNNLEYQFELQDLCDYVIAPTYSKPSADGAYRVLPGELAQASGNIEQALDNYCKACVASWDEAWGINDTTVAYTDMTVTRTAGIPHLGQMLRTFTDRLCDTYENGTPDQQQAIDSCTASAIKVELQLPNYDAIKYVKSIVNALPEVYGDDFYNQMKYAFNNCIVGQYFSQYLTAHEYMVDYSVMLGAHGAYGIAFWRYDDRGIPVQPTATDIYDEDGQGYSFYFVPTDDPQYYSMTPIGYSFRWRSTLDETYGQLAFDRTVGWTRWIRLNQQWPNLFCPNDMYFELPMPLHENQE